MIRVGVAGWDYPDWVGPVYPESTPRGFDRLAYLARFVGVIEINSTFYRPADPRTAENWLRRTEERKGFTFTAKAHRSWTHEKEPDLDGRMLAVRSDGIVAVWDPETLFRAVAEGPVER